MTAYRRYRCPGCSYVFDERTGDAHEGFKPGTRWEAVPDDWACPQCAVREKPDFEPLPAGENPVP
ncbi:rubredoxin [Panacagrimonas perspica]|uniref:Rubredoxin n=1 Tax=Panacagrimonas perspica TaxID=381431 RepID=A0A4R7PDU4_9GAMM|nr:rubredoxin [Panacagrimonas perspica]TDU31450.1 rubredoxin [Panacagrimonas perspica]THD03303.1 rubredoxin [Panacagrimonas perspica]